MARQSIILRHSFGLGDTVLLTALARDIQLQYPGRFDILVDCNFRETFVNHPYARPMLRQPEGRVVDVSIRYRDGIRAAGRGQKVHMMAWYHHDFTYKTGIEVYPSRAKAHLSLSDEESAPILSGQRYWVMMAGGKLDITNKWWWAGRWQEVVDKLSGQGITVVQAGANHREHRHPTLNGVVNMLGQQKSSREFFNLIQHADGVMGPVTAAMHIAAAYDKPCVVLSGGREEPWWESYTNAYGAFGPRCQPVTTEHRFLHTLGTLKCCQSKGCWKHRTTKLDDGRRNYDSSLCKLPVFGGDGKTAVPRCMDLIQSDHVVEAVMSYYERGEIPPIGEPKGTYSRSHDATAVRSAFVTAAEPQEIPKKLPARAPELIANDGITVARTLVSESPSPAITKAVLDVRRPDMIDHPYLGGRFTAFVLCYGDHFDLAQSCLESLFDTIPMTCLDLRVGLNAVCPATRAFVKGLEGSRIRKVYDHPENIKKYPSMREMFHDPNCPIRSEYLVWLDDDAKIVDAGMWSHLCRTIVSNHPHGSRLYGNVFTHNLANPTAPRQDGRRWFTTAPWWRNKNLRVKGQGMEAPNGTVIEFAAGWFWAMNVHTMREAQIPDTRLNHNGGDITIGEQVHQAGHKIKAFNKGKEMVWCPTREAGGRRGFSERFPWN
jgi:hypothetical protein